MTNFQYTCLDMSFLPPKSQYLTDKTCEAYVLNLDVFPLKKGEFGKKATNHKSEKTIEVSHIYFKMASIAYNAMSNAEFDLTQAKSQSWSWVKILGA